MEEQDLTRAGFLPSEYVEESRKLKVCVESGYNDEL